MKSLLTVLTFAFFTLMGSVYANSFPTLVSPQNGSFINNEDPTFRWSAPRTNTNIKNFEFCLSIKSSLCKSAKFQRGVARDTRGTIVALKRTTRSFSYKVSKLPSSFLGRKLTWSVGICSSTSCQYRAFRTFSWKIPPMGVRAAFNDVGADVYEIKWGITRSKNKVPYKFDASHIKKFIICIQVASGGTDCVKSRNQFYKYIKYTVEPKVTAETTSSRLAYRLTLYPRKYEEDRWAFTYLRNKKVKVTVHACTEKVGCTKQVNRVAVVPFLKESFMGALGNIATHSKCINCHTMDSGGAKYQEHIRENRFTRNTDVTNKNNCIGCHNKRTGFVDGWVAPESHKAYGDIPKIDVCRMIKYSNFKPHGYTMRLHLQIDPFVRWAVKKQGIRVNSYEADVKRVIPENNRDIECENEGTGLRRDFGIDLRSQGRTCLPDARCL